jgi:hypothetical protein
MDLDLAQGQSTRLMRAGDVGNFNAQHPTFNTQHPTKVSDYVARRRGGAGDGFAFFAAWREHFSLAGVFLTAVILGKAMLAEGNDLRWEETEVVVDAGLGQTEVERAFRMQNRGEGDIRVTKVSVSCSCTRVSASTNAVAPEAWGEVRATFDLRGRSGEQSKTIAVETDEAGGVPYLLRFVVRIPAWLVLDSREVTWAPGETTPLKSLRMRLAEGVPRLSVRAESSNPRIGVQLEVVGEREFRLDVRPDLSRRPLGGSVLLTGEGAGQNPVAEVCKVMVQ